MVEVSTFVEQLDLLALMPDWAKFQQAVSYQGLDLIVIYNKMVEREPDQDELSEDLAAMAILIAVRGVNITKMINRMSSEGVATVSKLVSKYTIASNFQKGKQDTITLGRIACLVPNLVASAMKLTNGRVVGVLGSLPRYLAFPSAPSIIPKGKPDLYESWIKWCITFDKQINSGKKDYVTDESRVRSFGEVSWDSNLFNEDQRNKILDGLSKLDPNAKMIEVPHVSVPTTMAFAQSAMPNEESKRTVLEAVGSMFSGHSKDEEKSGKHRRSK
jgi:hypothetical protein